MNSKRENIEAYINDICLWRKYPTAYAKLLKDHTTRKNIIWATDSYKNLGQGYGFHDTIEVEKIIKDGRAIIQPRVVKEKEEQIKRSKDKAEVFTPSWICNAQNNLIDEAWFGRPNVFNEEISGDDNHIWIPTEGKIEFPDEKGKTWKDYVKDIRLEITCGEAPYLVSRYDVVSGELLPVKMRVGILDRKLRVVGENTSTKGEWLEWAKKALECTYGYEWQGDSLLLAREALMLTVIEYYFEKFGEEIPRRSVEGLAYRISWNLWQMDGLKNVIPDSCATVTEINIFGEETPLVCPACKTGKGNHIGQLAYIRDWKAFHEYGNNRKDKTDIPFLHIINRK